MNFRNKNLKTKCLDWLDYVSEGVHPRSILHLEKAQDERYWGGSQNFREKHEFISKKAAFAAHLEPTKIADLLKYTAKNLVKGHRTIWPFGNPENSHEPLLGHPENIREPLWISKH